jgi:hypothetical protein
MDLRNAVANLNSSVRNKELRNILGEIVHSGIRCCIFFAGRKRSPETDGDDFDLLFTKGMVCSIRVDVDYTSEVINRIYRFVKIMAVVVLPDTSFRADIIYEVL